MPMIPDPPVTKLSPRPEIEAWIRELERLRADEALRDAETQRELEGHLNDARTWLVWDLHRRVVEEGEELMATLHEVGALTREPGAPPPEAEPPSGDAEVPETPRGP